MRTDLPREHRLCRLELRPRNALVLAEVGRQQHFNWGWDHLWHLGLFSGRPVGLETTVLRSVLCRSCGQRPITAGYPKHDFGGLPTGLPSLERLPSFHLAWQETNLFSEIRSWPCHEARRRDFGCKTLISRSNRAGTLWPCRPVAQSPPSPAKQRCPPTPQVHDGLSRYCRPYGS
jgi:hypothetical protein